MVFFWLVHVAAFASMDSVPANDTADFVDEVSDLRDISFPRFTIHSFDLLMAHHFAELSIVA